mgnify:CR=1 FL=1
MSKKDTLTEEDLFKSSIPIIDPNGQIADGNTVEVKPANVLVSYFQDNPIMSYSISFALIIVILILIAAIKKLSQSRNPMLEYTKRQTKKLKKDQAYVSSTNKLETPESLTDCIRAFIERTK